MNSTRLLTSDHIATLVRSVGVDRLMDAMIERIRNAYRSHEKRDYTIPIRDGFRYDRPATGLVEWMPIKAEEEIMMKLVGYHPMNPLDQGLPTIVSSQSMFCSRTGHLKAIIDGTFTTALRTGAAAAVASELLARSDSQTVGLIGCGAQAVTLLHAISRRFSLRDVLIYDVDVETARSLESRLKPLNLGEISIAVAGRDKVVASADILCVATSVEVGTGPVFEATVKTKPWLHINAIGSDLPGKIEVPYALLCESVVCPDFLAQAIVEGECQQLRADQIGPDIISVAQDHVLASRLQGLRTVFDSTGFALQDYIAMNLLLEHALKLDLGDLVALESISGDPKNPYEFLIDAEMTIEALPTPEWVNV